MPIAHAAPPPPNLLVLAKRLMVTAQISGTVVHLAVIASMWGNRANLLVLFGCFVLITLGAFAVVAVAIPRIGKERGEDLRTAFNLAAHSPIWLLCHWSFASWLFVPLLIALEPAPPARHANYRILATILAVNLLALTTDGRWTDSLAFCGIGVFIHAIISAYLTFANNLVLERERTLAELQSVQQLAIAQEKLASIGQLAAGVAHEINNPMCFITANVSDLLDDLCASPNLPPALQEYRDVILPETVDGIARVNSIVDDLRRFARGEPEPFVTFDLATEVTAAVRMARTQLKPQQRLSVDCPATLPFYGMPRQLGQVILNLIVNAQQSLNQAGEVNVRVAERRGQVEVAVIDSGVGMTEETLERIFQPFFTTKRQHRGVGLGLAVVQSIVKSHQGRIEVESAVGKGSCFRLMLPKLEDDAASAS